MPSKTTGGEKKYWYKVSVDTLRLWVVFVVLVVVGVGGYWGYVLLSEHLLERQLQMTLDEAKDLIQTLRGKEGLVNFRSEYETARASLKEAEVHVAEGAEAEALRSAERSRALLQSIRDALLRRTPGGEAQFISVQGGVEYRRGERGEWQQARSRVVLYAGDYIKTSGGGSAEVMTEEGALFTVRPDTVILVGPSRSEGGALPERTIALESGWVNLSTTRAASRITTPSAEARVQQRSEAVVSYDSERQVGRFAAYQGALEVTSQDGAKRRVYELQQVVQSGERLSSARPIPSAPILLAPRDNFEISLDAASRVALSWEPVEGAASYALQVSRNRLFVENIIDVERRRKTSATLGVRGEGSFVWRVAAFDGEGAKGPWSLPNRFRVTAQQGPEVPGSAEPLPESEGAQQREGPSQPGSGARAG